MVHQRASHDLLISGASIKRARVRGQCYNCLQTKEAAFLQSACVYRLVYLLDQLADKFGDEIPFKTSSS